jgi:hypothetical protein
MINLDWISAGLSLTWWVVINASVVSLWTPWNLTYKQVWKIIYIWHTWSSPYKWIWWVSTWEVSNSATAIATALWWTLKGYLYDDQYNYSQSYYYHNWTSWNSSTNTPYLLKAIELN